MKKQSFLAVSVCVLLLACTGIQINESAGYQAIAYASGRAMGLAINKISAELDGVLTDRWGRFMDQNTTAMIPPEETLQLFSDFSMQVVLHIDNPYGLLGDLAALLSIFGAEYDEDGELVNIQPVPKIVFMQFGNGYAASRAQIQREKS